MKSFHIFTLLAAGLFLAAAIATYQPASHTSGGSYSFTNSYSVAPVNGNLYPDISQPTTKAVGDTSLPVSLTPAFSYAIGKVRLMGAEGTRPFPAELSVTELTETTLPPLDQGMVNVTDYAAGYRMLPDGMVFNGDISIVLPYDSTLLPTGFTPDDIVTYYYDVRSGRWTAIGRDSVSTAEALVYSKVNHFTDFINAVIKTPEMPETSAFTPTSIKELEAANPLEGLQLIQAPTANNNGTANLSYQLEIPAGRQGMQPNLALTYSSSGGNGWLGVGWDISVPSITVDTRWGVPRYESSWESEVYIYGGEQLVTIKPSGEVRKMPHRTNLAGQTGRLPDGERFYTRAGEAHDSIVRHDTTTQTYWWEVVDRNGMTSYYGAYPPGDTTHGPTRIGGPDGIARWALAATVDPNGNMVRYYYSIEQNAGAGGDMGKQLYLDSINYTGYYSRNDSTAVPGAYTVVFHRNDGREDVTTNARYGFKEVTASTLCNAQVIFNNELVRTFFFVTDNSRESNYKTRLEHFIRVDDIYTLDWILQATQGDTCIDADTYGDIIRKTPIVHYDFEYFDYPEAGNMFSEPIHQNLHSDGVSSLFLSTSYDGTALGATKGKSWGVGGTVTVGYGPDVMTTYASGGANFGYNRSKNSGLLTLIDLDGDGLADKVYKQGQRVYYRPQIRISETQFQFGDAVSLDGISDFLLETSNDFDFGLQLSVVVLAASGGVPFSNATTTNYFADINGDGRPDLVTKKGVYFNCLNSNGTIHFSPASDLAAPTEPGDESYSAFILSDNLCDTFFWDGEIDPGLECGEGMYWDTTIYNIDYACSRPEDWGRHIISAGDTSFKISDCTYYHYGNEYELYCYCPDDGWDTLDVCSWTPWGKYREQLLAHDTIHIGDCYYYQPINSLKVVEIHPHNISQCGSGNGRDPDIDAVRVWIAPMDGNVKVTSRIRLLPDSSESRLQSRYVDGVSYTVQHSHGIICDTFFFAGLLDPAHYHACLTSEYDKKIISGNIEAEDTTYHTETTKITVSKGDMLFFDLNSKDNHSFDKVDWRHEITYQNMNYVGDQYGLDKRHYDSDEDFLLTGDSYFIAPKSGEVRISGTIVADTLTRSALVHIIKFSPATFNITDSVYTIPANSNYSRSFEGSGSISWQVDSGTVILFQAVPSTTGMRPNWSALTFNPVLHFISTFGGVQDTLEYHLPLHYDIDSFQVYDLQPEWLSNHNIWSAIAYPLYHNLFGHLYRGWGQFAYNNNTFRLPDRAIRLNRLIIPRAIMSPPSGNDNIFSGTDFDYDNIDTNRLTEEAYMDSLFESLNLYNPLSDSTSWVQVAPYPEYGAYMSYGNVAYISRDTMANTRMVDLNFRDADEADDDWDIPEYESVIPVSTDGFPVRTIRKQNKSLSGTGSFGANIPCHEDDQSSVSLSVSGTKGHNRITADCLDLNGDGFPDFITETKAQYTMPWGGLEGSARPMAGEICYTEAWSLGGNFGGSCLLPKRKVGQNQSGQPVTHEGSGSVSGNLGGGNDRTTFSYMDINGDGLPDKVFDGGTVCLNLGYGFSAEENWNQTYIRRGSNINTGVNVSLEYPVPTEHTPCSPNFNYAQTSISGGVGITHGSNTTINALADVNGDGMPDEISVPLIGNAYVSYNLGNGQLCAAEEIPVEIGQGASFSESLNLGVTVGFTFAGAWKLNFGVQGTPQSRSFNRDHLQLVDINGDGYADIVSSNSEDSMSVRYNQAGKTNLLRKVTNFCGAYTEMDYALSIPCYEQPQRQWNLQTVSTGELSSGFPTSQLTTLDSIEYRNPHYNRFERLPYGYDTVIVRQYNTEDNNSLYRFTVQGFNNRSFFKRGWKNSESICDADGKMWIEKLYHAILMDWEHPTDTVGEEDCIALAFTSYEAEITRYYEQENTPQIVTEIVRQYDPYRNVIRYENKGDTSHTDEYFSAKISYCHDLGHNLISLPDTIVVKDKQNQLLQKRVAHYDSLGNLASIEQFCGDSISRYDFYNNIYGGVDSLRMPRNYRGQRMGYAYEYDTVVHTYPVRTKDVFGYTSSATYDYRFGMPLTTTDLNGNTMKYHYDEWGRLDTLVGPNELAANKPYTITMQYHPYLSSGDAHTTDPASYAVTAHYDRQHPTNPIQTILFCDGTGRLLQTKKDAEVEGVLKLLNSGRVEYDCFGRTVKQYYPFASAPDDYIYNNHYSSDSLVSTTYDILDRQVKVKLPNMDSTMTTYSFGTDGGKIYFMTTATDPKGTSVSALTGTRRQQIKTMAPHGAVTTFTHDALGRLLSSKDPCNHITTYKYDMLGRVVSRNHPDAGKDTNTYDGAGNLLAHATQVLANANKTINYYYTFNRLDSIVYPDNTQNNVRYTYGDSTATHNQRGRIALLEDASGFQTFIYGKMGEVTENNRTFVLPNESQPYSFKMKYSYDSWNRVQDITYPDGEVVHYKYNTGGMLRQVQGQRSFFSGLDSVIIGPFDPLNPREDEYDDPTADNAPDFDTTGMGDRATYHNYLYNYITDIRYNEFELKSGQWYGNGTHAHYAYDILQRLSHLTAYNSANNAMQDISYTYDKASNITQISNAAGVVNTLGNTYSYSYTYDSLYRLTSSYGSIGSGKPLAYYNLNMQYEADGRITYKNQSGRTRLNGTVQTFNDSKSYTYNTSQPHTVQSISGTNYQWDANGNMTNDGGAALTWDEENRLTSHSKSFHRTCFFYDASGERYYKNTGSNMMLVVNGVWQMMTLYTNPTLYTSPYIVATKDGYTKHYYVESERFASRIGDGTITSLNTHATTASALAAKQVQVNDAAPDSVQPNKLSNLLSLPFNWSAHHTTYWQHSDHLGSASWVTDTNGAAYQHLQYMPWGEPLLDQRKSGYTYNTRYTFSGKERDEETGYSYFGARHYNSALSIWLSVDPMADKYPGVSPYTYCGNNPVRLVDPDGRAWEILGETYMPGTEYTGDNERTKILWGMMERIYATPLGKKVIDRMNNVTTVYKITDAKCSKTDNPCYYNPNHTIYLNQSGDLAWQSDPLTKTLAHEMFHGYQYLKGQGGTSTHNETEAYMFEGILFGANNNGLAPRRTDGLGDGYYEAFNKFREWNSVLPESEEEFNNVFRPIRKEYKQKSKANMNGDYGKYSIEIPKRNLLRELIFEQ